jgi:dienelactone hydrolase
VLHVHPGADHAFFDDTRPDVYDESTAKETFASTLRPFHSVLD